MACFDLNIGSLTGRYKSNEPERNIVFESPLIKVILCTACCFS
jgi:hypothetical protein